MALYHFTNKLRVNLFTLKTYGCLWLIRRIKVVQASKELYSESARRILLRRFYLVARILIYRKEIIFPTHYKFVHLVDQKLNHF